MATRANSQPFTKTRTNQAAKLGRDSPSLVFRVVVHVEVLACESDEGGGGDEDSERKDRCKKKQNANQKRQQSPVEWPPRAPGQGGRRILRPPSRHSCR